jgi:hypothetical protein
MVPYEKKKIYYPDLPSSLLISFYSFHDPVYDLIGQAFIVAVPGSGFLPFL